MQHIVLVTIGSLGDLHPFIAIGRALKASGNKVTLAVPADCVHTVELAGLEARAIYPAFSDICKRLRLSEYDACHKVLTEPNFVVEAVLLPSLETSTAALDDLAAKANVLVGSLFALASEIVAEKRGLPFASALLQPMTQFSNLQPPRTAQFSLTCAQPKGAVGRGWNRAFYRIARLAMHRRYAAQVNAVRAAHGLGPSSRAILFDPSPRAEALLCLWSAALGGLAPDAPARAVLTGFPFFDEEGAESGGRGAVSLPAELTHFLDSEPAPLVFTLGSFAPKVCGAFYRTAKQASERLGQRAVLLSGQSAAPLIDGNCLTIGYAPHATVFSRCSAIVHHGGIGTVGQALRAGKAQVVVPQFGDQFDNAARLEAAGLAKVLRKRSPSAHDLAAHIDAALCDAHMAKRAADAQQTVRAEDGAQIAALRILELSR